MAAEIPCIFHERICPKNCQAHEINKNNLKQLSRELAVRGITYKAILALLTDPDEEIGRTVNALNKKAHWSEEQIARQRNNMYNLRADINARRQQLLSDQQPYCIHNQ